MYDFPLLENAAPSSCSLYSERRNTEKSLNNQGTPHPVLLELQDSSICIDLPERQNTQLSRFSLTSRNLYEYFLFGSWENISSTARESYVKSYFRSSKERILQFWPA